MRYFIIAIRLALGLLFVYAGVQKFNTPTTESAAKEQSIQASPELPENVIKIKAFISGMKQTGYFWPMLGIAEIVCGLLLISQIWALLGAVMLVPLTLNIFLFEVFLGGGNITEIIIHGLYLLGNLLIIAYGYPRLKIAFLTKESSFQKLILS